MNCKFTLLYDRLIVIDKKYGFFMWFVYALSASLLWGLEYAINGQILQTIHSKTLLFLQLAVAFIVFFIYMSWSNHKLEFINDCKCLLRHREYIWLLAFSVFIYLIANLCIYQSIFLKNAALAAIIETSYPFFTFLFCYLLFKENFFSIKVLIGGLLIFIGVSVLSTA